jgi:DNA-binding NarL/FixJ family response regulator
MQATASNAPPDPRPLRVFLVEDSPLVRDRLIGMLGRSSHAMRVVGTCASALAATRAVLEAAPDIVLCDIQLRDGTGFNVLRELNARAPHIGVYMLSNFATTPYREHAAQLGARDFFDKSTEMHTLQQALDGLAAGLH